MNGRAMVKLSLGLALVFGLLLGGGEAEAQSQTSEVKACVERAADALVECVDDLPGWAEILCYSRYASDGILCAPSVLFKAI